jgi:hypothetical protein
VRRLRRTAPALLAIALAGCVVEERRAEQRTSASPAGVDENRALAARIAFERHALEHRRSDRPALGGRPREARCPDPSIRAETGDDESRTLVLGSEDARIDTRHLLPLSLTRKLASERGESTSPSPEPLAGALPSPLAMSRTLREIESSRRRRYGGIFHVTEYASPQLKHRAGKMRPEWSPGMLVSWLLVHDFETGELICQTKLSVQNDVRDEPIGARTKSTVRERLVMELALETRQKSIKALARITSVLKLPEI